MTQDNLEVVKAVADAVDLLVETARGTRKRLIEVGFSPQVAEVMSAHLFDHLVDRMFLSEDAK